VALYPYDYPILEEEEEEEGLPSPVPCPLTPTSDGPPAAQRRRHLVPDHPAASPGARGTRRMGHRKRGGGRAMDSGGSASLPATPLRSKQAHGADWGGGDGKPFPPFQGPP